MTARRSSGRNQPVTWKDPRRRAEVARAVVAAGGVVVITALVIFLIRPGDSSPTPTPTPIQNQVPQSVPQSTVPIDPTATTAPGEGTTATTAASTPLPQP
jgi:hypothetical protein